MDSLGDAAEALVGAVTEAARALAEEIERDINGEESPPVEPRVELLWASLLFILHVADRLALAHLCESDRELFMSLLASLAREIDESLLRAEYNAAQIAYSASSQILPAPGEGLGGTLWRECYQTTQSCRG